MESDWVSHLVANLRERDREEVAEYWYSTGQIEASIRMPHVALRRFDLATGEPAAALWFDALTPKALIASMLATDAWPRVARAAYRYATREAPAMLTGLGYVRAECRTMAGHDDAIRFLERVGFTLDCRLPMYGAGGRSFAQYSWKLRDHVFL